ncbi:MAG: alpha/beta fold hydrolase [Ilumatobacteraceae bacterium]
MTTDSVAQIPGLPNGFEIELPGRGKTFYREKKGPAGAPTLMLLHGWTATADLNWFTCFDALSENFNVVALDLRGHLVVDGDMQALAAALNAALLDEAHEL